MEEEFLYRKIQEMLENIPQNFSVLEEQIDVELQIEYFKFAKNLREKGNPAEYLSKTDLLFDPAASADLKKKILASLASSGEVEDFRTIEKFLANPDKELKDWAILACQEGRMLLQSTLLDEQQVFISTGLGGKGHKLRYFIVFIHKSGENLSEMQKKLLRDELIYTLEKNEGEMEEFSELLDFTTALVILPLRSPLKDIFRSIIDECNQYGNFLKDDMVITNVKRLNPVEIVEILNQQHNLSGDPEEDEDTEPDDEEE